MINYWGIVLALTACASWALSFVLPLFIPHFTAPEIAIGRYFAYGLLCLGFFIHHLLCVGSRFSRKVWKMAFIFALTGNLLYYSLEVAGLKLIGSPLVALLFALMPVSVSLYGNYRERSYPFKIMALPLLLVFLGVMTVRLTDMTIDPDLTALQFLGGVGLTLSSIAMWAWYGVHNARFLKDEPELNIWQFNMLIGVCCFAISSLLMGVLTVTPGVEFHLFSPEVTRYELFAFVGVSLALGWVGTWFGTICWHTASRLLPVALAGQIIVGETCSGLTYNYIYQQAFPGLQEIFGFFLVIGGVLTSLSRVQAYMQQTKITE